MASRSFCQESHIDCCSDRPHTGCSEPGFAATPIAVVGMAMRLPGDVRSSNDFWETVIHKKDGHSKIPKSRFEIDSFHHRFAEGFLRIKHGYFLQEDPAYFDAGFFNIPEYEASRFDPQQRLLLEVVYECLENAGEVNWAGKNIGCYVGTFGEDWLGMAYRDPLQTDRSHAISTGGLALANTLSYQYDFRGPSMTIETGCSSSLVGLHEACQALTTGSCSSAIVAGTNLILAPTMTASMCSNMVLSPGGISRTFDAKADGYGRGEAINAIYIKRLDDALREKDPIRAVIRSTATNSDGKTEHISAPSLEAQESLVRTAYQRAGIQVESDTGYVECHGTGTQAGDSVECTTVSKVFAGIDMIIGGVKPNFGHSEGASGLTSVIKAILALENEIIPPNAHFDNPNEALKKTKLIVPRQPMPWPENRRKRVSVNGFGIGGSNAHAILDSASDSCYRGTSDAIPLTGPTILVVSAGDAMSLDARIRQIIDYANSHPELLADLAFTLSARREHMSHRAYAICNKGTLLDPSDFSKAHSNGAPSVSFVFTGQGAQWAGMGKGLMETDAGFREDMAALSKTLKGLQDPPVWQLDEELIRADASRVKDAEFSQPLTTAVQIGLVNLLARLGVQPKAVLGHSSGEIAAAYTAGAISASSAIVTAYHRGRMAKTQVGMGEMASIGLSIEDVTPFLVDGVVVACHNSPRNVTISGDLDKVDHVVEQIKAQLPDVFCRRLRVNVAYHSHHMNALGASYAASIEPYVKSSERMVVPMYSTVTGRAINNPFELGADYWRDNLESPVRFFDAVNALIGSHRGQHGHMLVEIGPHSALSSPINQILQHREISPCPVYVHTLVRHDPDIQQQILSVVGKVHINGASPDLRQLAPLGRPLTDLPPYPWNHTKKYWCESRLVRDWRFTQHPYHELLGLRCPESTDIEPSWRNLLSLNTVPWVSAHVLQGQVIFPGAGYIAMAGEAVRQLCPDITGYSVKEVQFKNPLVPKDSGTVETITTLRRTKINDLADSSWFLFTITSYDGSAWVKNCTGKVCPGSETDTSAVSINRYARQVSSLKWYDALSALGLSYGTQFAGLRNITADPCAYRASAQVTDTMNGDYASRYFVHPTMIDQCLQLMTVAPARGLSRHLTTGGIPVSIDQMYVSQGGGCMDTMVDVQQKASCALTGNANSMVDGRLVLSICGAQYFSLGDDRNSAERQIPLVARMRWMPDINYQDPESLFPRMAMTDHVQNTSSLFKKISALYILQTEQLIRDVLPNVEHMAKWKTLITASSSTILEDYRSFLESSRWFQLSEPDRWGLVAKMRSELTAENDFLNALVDCIAEVHDHCLELMSGSLLAVDVLMKDDSLSNYYDSTMRLTDWSRYVQLLSHSNPRLRILEIGAGTGSATTDVLSWLYVSGAPSYASYVFTDISPGFMAAARERFRQHEGLEYKVLDISCDPLSQGYSAHTFDLIIASNVLHATPNLKQTLTNVRKLLAPQGHLLLHELTPAGDDVDYIMGTLPGWWLGESDDRANKPYVSPERWHEELQSCGFTGADVVRYDLEPPHQHNATILSRVASSPPDPTSCLSVTLITDDSSHDWVQSIAAALQSMDYTIRWGTLEESPTPNDFVVFLMDVQKPFLNNISEDEYHLLNRYLDQAENCTILWVTKMTQLVCEDPSYALVHGFARTIRVETMVDLCVVEVDTLDTDAARLFVDILGNVRQSRQVTSEDRDSEFSIYRGEVHVSRCFWERRKEESSSASHAPVKKLEMKTAGLFDTFYWAATDHPDLGPEDIEVKVCYVGLNFRDIMMAMGLVGDKLELGVEGTGIVERVGSDVEGFTVGDKVLLLGGSFLATHAIQPQQHCIRLPDTISMEDMATMAVVFVTAVYCFVYITQVQKEQSVLIHCGCGGVGLAAIQTCRVLGVEKIFVTVGNDMKRDHLIKTFGIPADHILESRNKSFVPALMKLTGGRGVDIVLNSLSGELLHASWECVAPFGKMIELGKRDFLFNGTLPMSPFAENRTFYGVDVLGIAICDRKMFTKVIKHLIGWYMEGKIHPIRPVTVYEATAVLEAFRYMQSGEHIGKLLIKMPDDPTLLPVTHSSETIRFSPEASYLLIGGLGGVGRAVSIWMAENGARSLVYLSRRELTEDDKQHLKELEAMGCSVDCVKGDVACLQDVQRAVAKCPQPLKGVLHMALSLHDGTFSKMSHEQWGAGLDVKVCGTWNLHRSVSAQDLDFFVMFSSTAGICGNTAQANYAAANTFVDSFAQYRRQCGLPASALVLGAVEEVGLVSRDPKLVQYFKNNGIYMLKEAEVLDALRRCIRQPFPSNSDALKAQWSIPLVTGLGDTGPASGLEERQIWLRDTRFISYSNLQSLSAQTDGSALNSQVRELINQIQRDPSILLLPETEVAVAKELAGTITQHLPGSQVSEESLTIDSLMAIELRNWLRRNLGLEVAMAEMSKARTVGSLASLTIEHLKVKHSVGEPSETPASVEPGV